VPNKEPVDIQVNASKYKSTTKKIKPVNEPMPENLNPPLCTPPLSRDPHEISLTAFPPVFTPTSKITEERLKVVNNFGPPGWLSEEELKLMKNVIKLRQGGLAFRVEERGLLKHTYGKP
jgi:hypothetical protein